jgi:ubiquitin-like protein Pup
MAERIQRPKSTGERESASDTDIAASTEASVAQGERLKAEMDDILDEIDDVLETNAEDFVKSYIQKGGE